jgi:SAM-dependent methyltransferase
MAPLKLRAVDRKVKWPKDPPRLSEEDARLNDDWQEYWFSINAGKFSAVVAFGHEYVARHAPKTFLRTLEVGAGLGEQLRYERMTSEQLANYVALEARPNMADTLQRQWPGTRTVVADCQKALPFPDGHFDRIVAIHVLEHLPDLPAFLRNARGLLAREGRFQVVIPCEGGFGYEIGREFTSKRIFERRYGRDYKPFIEAEHVNTAREILPELYANFRVLDRAFYPLRVPSIDVNLCIGLTLS